MTIYNHQAYSPLYVWLDVWSVNVQVDGAWCCVWCQMSLLRRPLDQALLTLKVLHFWKFTSYCSLKPLWLGMGEVVPARTLPTLHPPSPPTVHQLSWLALKELIALKSNSSSCMTVCIRYRVTDYVLWMIMQWGQKHQNHKPIKHSTASHLYIQSILYVAHVLQSNLSLRPPVLRYHHFTLPKQSLG